MTYDLFISGGRVIDPATGLDRVADVGITDGKIAAVGAGAGRETGGAKETIDATGMLVVPGLIDLHAHVYVGCTPLSIDADPLAARSGTTTMVDCGSVGAATFDGFRRFVVEPSKCRVLAFVNISVIGLVAMPECGYGRFVDSNAALSCIEENRDLVVGVKVRSSRNALGDANTAQPIWMAAAAARAAEVPVVMHIGDPPATLEQGLEILASGDMVTHAFKGQPVTRIVDRSLKVKGVVREAREKGVKFDIGHGSGSFSWEVSHALAEQGFWPDTISTDVHKSSIKDPISIDMPNAMSKLLHLGMPLVEVVRASTHTAAQLIGWDDRIGSLEVGREADVAVLAMEEGQFALTDSYRKAETAKKRFVARHTIRAGERLGA